MVLTECIPLAHMAERVAAVRVQKAVPVHLDYMVVKVETVDFIYIGKWFLKKF